ncbi:uncharacterized protein LOC131048262 isoform X2 [Cryptomeria japonica]|uniref:uncharacterized protein LOC131048262 isoform X2 n=1 Tax=Cryptomeria japonica TaxID=3369 RepID=UPI0027DA2350|nr:uncharacterized protein LOC131048262 isoform X2 [Cryptomeria japonica]
MSLLPRWQRLHARCSRRSLSMAGLREGMEGFYLTCKIRPYFPIQLAEAGATGKCEHRSRGREGNRASVVQKLDKCERESKETILCHHLRFSIRGDEGNREAIAQILQSVEKARRMVGGLALVAFLLDQIEEISENRSEYIELLRQMFKLAGYIRRMMFLKGFVNHEGLGTVKLKIKQLHQDLTL